MLQMATYDVRAEPIPFLVFGKRLHDVLVSLDVHTWGDLAALSKVDLLTMKGMGQKTVTIAEAQLRAVGLAFSGQGWTRRRFNQAPTSPAVLGVYFIGLKEFVKIGWSTDIRKRVSDLSLATPFGATLMAHIPTVDRPAARQLEKELHVRFREYRHHREWFRHEGEVVAFIDGLKA